MDQWHGRTDYVLNKYFTRPYVSKLRADFLWVVFLLTKLYKKFKI